jgi:hypothetical protein
MYSRDVWFESRQGQLLNSSEFIGVKIAQSVATGYGMDDVGLIPERDKIFLLPTISRLALGPTQPPIQWILPQD